MHMLMNAFAISSAITIELSGLLSCERCHTNSPRCLKQRPRSNCTPTQSDARMKPVSTRCQATIGQPVKRHSNVVALAGQGGPLLDVKQELKTYAHTRLTRLYSEWNCELMITKHLICSAVTSENLIILQLKTLTAKLLN